MNCEERDFESDLEELASAEDFLDYFEVPYQPSVVQVNRLHILQRFHDYLAKQEAGKAPDYAAYRRWLVMAYEDFVKSDALTERVFTVLQKAAGTSFQSATDLFS
ncbi:MAG: nitrogenase-stabilizing/protective protein NifW [Rhodocyclaceae bacterium]|nr:nitrogenase-stabilizing/protective protein NifW [Rhodocyclaceae bacterium]